VGGDQGIGGDEQGVVVGFGVANHQAVEAVAGPDFIDGCSDDSLERQRAQPEVDRVVEVLEDGVGAGLEGSDFIEISEFEQDGGRDQEFVAVDAWTPAWSGGSVERWPSRGPNWYRDTRRSQ
jgi:hypothetical protein